MVAPGTGLDLAAPLKFNHAANLPFSDRGTGISFQPATAFAHSSNEPVQALGTGITLDSPLAKDHAIDAVVRDAAVTTAGYQGTPAPNQWFGGPELTATVSFFGRPISVREGSMVLRDAAGLVVDSLNYGGLVDPWAAEGYQATSGSEQSGCHVPAPGAACGIRPFAAIGGGTNRSAGRFPDGADTDSNCTDFLTQAATTLSAASAAGATNIKVASVEGFRRRPDDHDRHRREPRDRRHRDGWHGRRHHGGHRRQRGRDRYPRRQRDWFRGRPDHHHRQWREH